MPPKTRRHPSRSGWPRPSSAGFGRDLVADVYRWTGHFPERTRLLLRHLAERADQMTLVYPEAHETSATVALTTLVTTLAMNHVQRGTYLH